MKNIVIYIICFYILFIFTGCDYFSAADITIVNNSSYDLKIKIEYKDLPGDYYNGNEEINIIREDSASFELIRIGGRGVEPRDPNNDIINILFFNMTTEEIIKKLDNNNYFELSKNEKYNAKYRIEITDELLF